MIAPRRGIPKGDNPFWSFREGFLKGRGIETPPFKCPFFAYRFFGQAKKWYIYALSKSKHSKYMPFFK